MIMIKKMSRCSKASFTQQMSDLVSLTIEQGRYHVIIFFKLDLSASYAGHAPFWFAFVQNLQSAQQVECILVSVQHQQCRSCLGYMRQPKYQYVCMQTFLCCVCVCTGSSSERTGESQTKPGDEAGAAAERMSCGLPHKASQSLLAQASQACPDHSLGAHTYCLSA